MGIEREGSFEFRGEKVTIVGPDLWSGDPAPEFTAYSKDWSPVKALESTRGKIRIIGALPSLNSSVCDRETRRFNQEAAALGEQVAILMVSMDLPWTLRSWCAAAGVDQVTTLGDHVNAEFGEKYGVLLKEVRIFRRAIFVVDAGERIVYADYMPVLGAEPDYEAVLEAARRTLATAAG
jgi:thiol peroxidase